MEVLFSVGQRVVCVDSSFKTNKSVPLVEGKTYVVNGIHNCTCGFCVIDVGFRYTGTGRAGYTCPKCKSRNYTNSVWYLSQFRFVPLDDNDAIEDEIRESLNLHLKV